MYISNRRTLSDAIAARLGFKSYEDISGLIDITVHNRLVCQVDSLHRITNITSTTLLIYDEFCSILSHIAGITENNIQKQANFINSFEFPATRIYMDGFLTSGDVNLIKTLSKQIPFIFKNTYKPYIGNNITVFPYWHTGESGDHVIHDIITALQSGKRLMVSVSSYNLATHISEQINHIGIKHKLYTGADLVMDGACLHKDTKKQDFQDVMSAWSAGNV